MSLQLPEGLMQALAAAHGGAPPQAAQPLPAGLDQGGEQDESGYSELDCLKDVIDDFPKLLTELTDPKDVEQAVGALKMLAGIQSRLMSAAGANGPPQAG